MQKLLGFHLTNLCFGLGQ